VIRQTEATPHRIDHARGAQIMHNKVQGPADGYVAATAPLSRPEDLENYLRRVSVQGPRAITFAARPAHRQPAAFNRPGGLDPSHSAGRA
jgi:hypothetical protein